VILFFGLRPKGFKNSNNVKWISDQSGIRFGQYGLAYTDPIKELSQESGSGGDGFSIEIALKPLNIEQGFSLILALHAGKDSDQLLVGQWQSSIIAMNGDDYAHKRKTKTIAVNVASQSQTIIFITITTGKEGTKAYINGHLINTQKDLGLKIPDDGNARLLAGNSVYGRHSWKGCIYGLAFYKYDLPAQVVDLHFDGWIKNQNFSFAGEYNPFLLYLFDERSGERVLDHSGGGHDLKIPPKIPILDRKFLSSEWDQLDFDLKSFQDVFINLVGFIPLGFMLAATFIKAGPIFERNNILITVILCFTVSLTIEIVQAWIPSRSSDSLDLMLNTLGGFFGAMIYCKGIRLKEKGQRIKDTK
jgi:hypothetical protein